MDQKTFYQAIRDFNEHPLKASKVLQDKRLTLVEKKIMEGIFLVRDNKNQEALELLSGIQLELPIVVRLTKDYFMGLALNNLGHFLEAKSKLNEVCSSTEISNFAYLHYSALDNLFNVYFNLKDKEGMESSLAVLRKMENQRPNQKLKLVSCHFRYYMVIGQNSKAKKCLDELSKHLEEMTEPEVMSHLVNTFMFHVKLEDFEAAYESMKIMKSYRKFHLTENYNYMKILLDHYTKGSPIYFYEADFKNAAILGLQLRVIQKLEEGNYPEAQVSWDKLCSMYPNHYLENFKYAGDKGIFSLCLEKHLKKQKIAPMDLSQLSGSNQMELVVSALQASEAPILKEELCRLIWGIGDFSKDDFNRLKKLMYKIKVKYGLEVKSIKGSYVLVHDKKALKQK